MDRDGTPSLASATRMHQQMLAGREPERRGVEQQQQQQQQQPQASTARDERIHPLGENRCFRHRDCDGARTCSGYGFCQGVAVLAPPTASEPRLHAGAPASGSDSNTTHRASAATSSASRLLSNTREDAATLAPAVTPPAARDSVHAASVQDAVARCKDLPPAHVWAVAKRYEVRVRRCEEVVRLRLCEHDQAAAACPRSCGRCDHGIDRGKGRAAWDVAMAVWQFPGKRGGGGGGGGGGGSGGGGADAEGALAQRTARQLMQEVWEKQRPEQTQDSGEPQLVAAHPILFAWDAERGHCYLLEVNLRLWQKVADTSPHRCNGDMFWVNATIAPLPDPHIHLVGVYSHMEPLDRTEATTAAADGGCRKDGGAPSEMALDYCTMAVYNKNSTMVLPGMVPAWADAPSGVGKPHRAWSSEPAVPRVGGTWASSKTNCPNPEQGREAKVVVYKGVAAAGSRSCLGIAEVVETSECMYEVDIIHPLDSEAPKTGSHAGWPRGNEGEAGGRLPVDDDHSPPPTAKFSERYIDEGMDATAVPIDPMTLRLKWKYETNGAVVSSPTMVVMPPGRPGLLASGVEMLIFGSDDHNVRALNAVDGTLIWMFPTAGAVGSSPLLFEFEDAQLPFPFDQQKTVAFGSDDGYVYALDATHGGVRWSYHIGGPIRSSPSYVRSPALCIDDGIVIGSDNGGVYRFDAPTGNLRWSLDTGSAVRSSPRVGDIPEDFHRGPVSRGFDARGGPVHSRCPSAGEPAPQATAGKTWLDEVAAPVPLTKPPVLRCEWSPHDRLVGGLDTRAERSARLGDGIRAPEAVFVGSQNGNMFAIDALNGSVIWSYHAGLDWVVDGDHISSSPAISYDDGSYLSTAGKADDDLYKGHQLFFGAEDSHLYALQLLTGDVTWSFLTSGPIRSTPTLSDGMVYAGSTDGRLYKLQADTGRLVWSYGFGSMNASLGMSHAYRDWSLKALLHVNGTNQSGWREPHGFLEDQSVPSNSHRGLDASVHKERSAEWMGWQEPASTERWFSSENLTEFSQRWWENATANATVPGDVYGSPVVDDAAQTVYVGTRDRKLYALDAEDGSVLWSYATDGFLDSTPLVYSHEGSAQVFVGSFDGHVYAFGPDAPLPPRPSPPPSPRPPPPFSSPPPYIRKLRRSPRHFTDDRMIYDDALDQRPDQTFDDWSLQEWLHQKPVAFRDPPPAPPPPPAVCIAGYSREWNFGCQSYCICNEADGSPKAECKYCCKIEAGGCHREEPLLPQPARRRSSNREVATARTVFKSLQPPRRK